MARRGVGDVLRCHVAHDDYTGAAVAALLARTGLRAAAATGTSAAAARVGLPISAASEVLRAARAAAITGRAGRAAGVRPAPTAAADADGGPEGDGVTPTEALQRDARATIAP